MCGIAGEFYFGGGADITLERAELIGKWNKYRGPDANGYLLKNLENDTNFALIHHRLSIIDLSQNANQPLESCRKDAVICFNGEIYNYREIKKMLLEVGAEFKTNSDTEVILNGFEYFGIQKTVELLDGMFAFAIYSYKTNELYLVRDRFGKKPLYYYRNGNHLIFSSDIRSFEVPGVNLTLSSYAMGYFFQELSTPYQNSIYNEIIKVPPATILKVWAKEIEIKKYWESKYEPKIQTNRLDVLQNVEDLLYKAVQKRLIADVKVGAFLSAGIDSSLIATCMANIVSAKIDTYTVGYKSYEKNELEGARLTANKIKSNHHEIIVDLKDLSFIDGLIEEFGEPFADSSMIPTYLLCKAASRNQKVMLSGDGGDEVFGGYYEYYQNYRLDTYLKYFPISNLVEILGRGMKHKSMQLLTELNALAKMYPPSRLSRNMGFSSDELKLLLPGNEAYSATNAEFTAVWTEHIKYKHELDKIMSSSMNTRLVNDYLVKVDRASMYAAVEVRSPFLDLDLVKYTNLLPASELLNEGIPKSILKELGKKLLAKELLNRPKTGFGIPIGRWLKMELKEDFAETVFSRKQNKVEMNYGFLENQYNLHLKGERDFSNKLWAVYVFHKWAQRQNK